jgi:hypothetical protein
LQILPKEIGAARHGVAETRKLQESSQSGEGLCRENKRRRSQSTREGKMFMSTVIGFLFDRLFPLGIECPNCIDRSNK